MSRDKDLPLGQRMCFNIFFSFYLQVSYSVVFCGKDEESEVLIFFPL